MLQNNIYKWPICYFKFFIYNDFLRIFDIVGNLKTKCGHLDLLFRRIAKVEVNIATFSYWFTSRLLASMILEVGVEGELEHTLSVLYCTTY